MTASSTSKASSDSFDDSFDDTSGDSVRFSRALGVEFCKKNWNKINLRKVILRLLHLLKIERSTRDVMYLECG
jgi:hypothetical protein